MKNTLSIKEGLSALCGTDKIEASSNSCQLINGIGKNGKSHHGLLLTVQLAHSHHHPLQLSPDCLWTMMMQGFSTHMKINHEKLRSKFVNFENRQKLSVSKNHFIKGSSSNNWPEVFDDFVN